MIKSLKELDTFVIGDVDLRIQLLPGYSHSNDKFPKNKLLWCTLICEENEKIRFNKILPVFCDKDDSTYFFFSPNGYFIDEYNIINNVIAQYKIPISKVDYCIPYNYGFHNESISTDINDWDIKLFDNPRECEDYRKIKEKELRELIKSHKADDKKYTVTIEDIESKFNIPHGKLIIEGVWNDPYTKVKRKK